MGSGKTTVAIHLANALRLHQVDLDTKIEAQTGITVRKIFEEQGEARFRKIESQMLKEILEGQPTVVALGGGTPIQEENSKLIFNQDCITIYLKYNSKILTNRLFKHRTKRPLLIGYNTIEKLQAFINLKMEGRSSHYEKANFIIQDETNINQTSKLIINYLKFNDLIDQ